MAKAIIPAPVVTTIRVICLVDTDLCLFMVGAIVTVIITANLGDKKVLICREAYYKRRAFSRRAFYTNIPT